MSGESSNKYFRLFLIAIDVGSMLDLMILLLVVSCWKIKIDKTIE